MAEMEKKSRTKKVIKAVQSSAIEPIKQKKTRKKTGPVIVPPIGIGPQKAIRKKATPKMTAIKISHEEIANLAHRYWAERGGQHGNHVEDWLRAERALLGKAS